MLFSLLKIFSFNRKLLKLSLFLFFKGSELTPIEILYLSQNLFLIQLGSQFFLLPLLEIPQELQHICILCIGPLPLSLLITLNRIHLVEHVHASLNLNWLLS